MSWFKVDDTLHSHPKVRRAGAAAVGVWATAGSFCMAYKTNGFVPTFFLDGWGKVGHSAAKKLVEAGLWIAAERDGQIGYEFHDWADYQPLSDEIERDRERARERQRAWRQRRKGHGRASAEEGEAERVTENVTRDETCDETNDSQHPVPTRPDPSRPDPTTLPTEEYLEATSIFGAQAEATAEAAAKPSRRRVRLPEDWAPSEKLQAYALERGVDPTSELEAFRDYHHAKGSVMAEWEAAWRTWVRNAQKFAARPARGGDDRSPAQRNRDRQAELWRARSQPTHQSPQIGA